jgi:hypothetical protein
MPCTEYPLNLVDGHLFVEAGDKLWLLDTGAPTSFGVTSEIGFAGEQFALKAAYMGLTAERLSEYVRVPCAGLLGTDVLGQFDLIIDGLGNTVRVSRDTLTHAGSPVELDSFMGIPIVEVRIDDSKYRMFFDTGAQVSYLQDDVLEAFPHSGAMQDSYPGFGEFRTEIYDLAVRLGARAARLRCGRLPALLGASLMLADVQGILGNEILAGGSVGYFPRRHLLSL